MKDVLVYKDYRGSVHFNADDEVFFGKIEGIEDLVSFEGDSVIELKKAFEEAVNDYLEICKETVIERKLQYPNSSRHTQKSNTACFDEGNVFKSVHSKSG